MKLKLKSNFTAPILCLAVYLLILLSRLIDVAVFGEGQAAVYLSVVVVQILAFMLPAVFYIALRGGDLRTRLRFTGVAPDRIPFVLVAAAVMLLLSLLYDVILTSLGGGGSRFSLYENYVSGGVSNVADAVYIIVCFAALPAVCEEFVFRGILLAEYEQNGIFGAVIFSSALFAMLHFSAEKLPLYFLCGILLALTVYATRSVLSAIIVHFLFNLFGLFGQSYINSVIEMLGDRLLLGFLLTALLLLALVIFFAQAERIYNGYYKKNKSSDYRPETKGGAAGFASNALAIPFLACIIVFILAMLF